MLSWSDQVELAVWWSGDNRSHRSQRQGQDPETIRRYRDNSDLTPGTRRSGPALVDEYVDYIDARLEDNGHLPALFFYERSGIWATPAPTRPWPDTCKRFGPTARAPGAKLSSR
jgi:hypothetical protein